MTRKIGEILIENELLSPDQLQQGLLEHKRANMKLGEFLVGQGMVDEFQLADSLAKQLKLERYRTDTYFSSDGLAELVPADVAQKHQVIPLRKNGDLLTLGMVDPRDIHVIDRIESLSRCEVEAVVVTEQEFNQLVVSLYGARTGIGGILEDLQYNSEDENEEPVLGDYLEVSSLQNKAEEAPVIRLVNEILSQAVRERASDVHISPEKDTVQVRFRVDGRLHPVPSPPKHMILPIISRLKLLSNMDIAVMRAPQDGRFTIKMNHKEINVRASTIPTIYGENLVLRLLDTSGGVYSLEKLGMTRMDQNKVEMMLGKPYGMILSTGPTGSGKTTSLYSLLKKINQPDINIITLEDPVEYRIDNIRQTQLNRKAGMTFANGIRSLLRQDPDVIMVGEIRDAETATIAVQAALTGHRVFSTMHTNNAAGAITRFSDMGIAPFLTSSVLVVLIAQRLVRKVCPQCREPFTPPAAVLNYWGVDLGGENQFYQAKGCFHCINTGYADRTGVFEVLVIDEMIQEMILKNRSAHEITRAAQQTGKLKTLKENVSEKIRMGITTFEEAGSVVMI